MVRLHDSVLIDVPPERVWAWLSELPRHYRDWHPAHIECRYIRGENLAAGAVLQVKEKLHGKLHSLVLHAEVVVPYRLLRYSGHGFRGAFILEPRNRGTCFTAEVEFGIRLSVVDWLLDGLLHRVFAKQLFALHAHMREENVNLKHLLELESRSSGATTRSGRSIT